MVRKISIGLVLFVMLVVTPVLALGAQDNDTGLLENVLTSSAAAVPWFITEVDTPDDTGQYTSVAIDPSRGWTYISYYDATNQALRMARHGSPAPDCDPISDWGCLTIDSGADTGRYSSIAVNPVTGGIGIAYHDATNGKLKYAYFDNPHLLVYSTYTIDIGIFPVSSTGLYASLKFDDYGKPFIAYHFNNPTDVDALMFSYYSVTNGNCPHPDSADSWRCETIITGEGVGQYASLALDAEGEQHIAYYDGANGDLWYATSVGDENCGAYGADWLCYPVTGSTTDAGKYSSIYVDDGGHFHIAYYDATNDTLNYAVDVGSGGNCGVLGSAQCDEIDSMQADYHPLGISIAEDAAGYPIIAYQSYNDSLNVARPAAAVGLSGGGGNCGPGDLFSTWYCETIDRSGTYIEYRNGDYISIAMAPSGAATIAYNRLYFPDSAPPEGNLMVAKQQLQKIFLPLTVKGG